MELSENKVYPLSRYGGKRMIGIIWENCSAQIFEKHSEMIYFK